MGFGLCWAVLGGTLKNALSAPASEETKTVSSSLPGSGLLKIGHVGAAKPHFVAHIFVAQKSDDSRRHLCNIIRKLGFWLS